MPERVDSPEQSAPQTSLQILHKIRREQLQELERSALAQPAAVEAIVARIQHLTNAIAALEKDPSRKRNRTLTIVLVTLAIVLTGTLLLLRRPTAGISIETKATEISFQVAAPLSFFAGVSGLESVDVIGLSRIQPEGGPAVQAAPDDDLRLHLKPDASVNPPGEIGLESLVLPAGTRVTAVQTGIAREIDVTFEPPSDRRIPLTIDAAGKFTATVPRFGAQKLSFATSGTIACEPSTAQVRLVLHFRENTDIAFSAPFPVQFVSWLRVVRINTPEQQGDIQPKGGREESSIVSGALLIEDLKATPTRLRSGEPLRLKVQNGQIRQLRSDGAVFSSMFDGAVSEVSTGAGDNRDNLMPTWLSWMRAQDALVQFWAFAAYGVGLALAVYRWWREPA